MAAVCRAARVWQGLAMGTRHFATGCGIVVVTLIAACGRTWHAPPVAEAPMASGVARRITFDDLRSGHPPTGFLCAAPGPADAKPARWEVIAVPDAPSGSQVLAQLDDDDTNNRFPMALVADATWKDVRVAVQAKAVAGARDRSFGVVVRARDERNYYVARANTSGWGENVRFYKVVDGKRGQLEEWEGDVKPGAWHRLQVDALGDDFTVTLDGKAILHAHDATFPAAGMVGVWTKAEAVSWFDDLTITGSTP